MPELLPARPLRANLRLSGVAALPVPLLLAGAGQLLLAAVPLLLLTPGASFPSVPILLFWTALLAGAEVWPVRLPRGGSLAMSGPILAACIVLHGPLAAAWTALLAALVAHGVAQRRPAVQVMLHASSGVVAALAAGAVYRLAGGVPGGGCVLPGALLPLTALLAADFVVRSGLAALAGALAGRQQPWRSWRERYGGTLWHLPVVIPIAAAAAAAAPVAGWLAVAALLLPLVGVRRALAAERARAAERDGLARTLVAMLGEVDPYTRGHSLRVACYAERLARALALGQREVERVRLAALLHDVGKVGQERRVLTKPARLSDYERLCMQTHPAAGAAVLEQLQALRDVAEIVRHHHERIDGRGYPGGLHGAAIPLGARIVLVADAFDAMTSHRSYRPGMPVARVLAELERHQGRQFDPRVVAAFAGLVRSGELVPPSGAISQRATRLAS